MVFIYADKVITYDYDTNELDIVSKNTINTDVKNYFFQYVPITDDDFFVMQIFGVDPGDNEFKIINENEYEELLQNYIDDFDLKDEEISTTVENHDFEHFFATEIHTFFDCGLCRFSLYHFTIK